MSSGAFALQRAPAPRETPRPGPVYAIADALVLGRNHLPDAVARFAQAGIQWIQLRAKSRLTDRELYQAVEACCRAVEGTPARLWVDDRADLAALFPLAGVHVGQRDLPPEAVRRVIGPGGWIGLSTHTAAELEAADRDPEVDVIAFGPIFPTVSKAGAEPPVGLELLRFARRLTRKPLVAIGGIQTDTLASVLAAGADSAVLLSAVCAGDVGENLARLQRAIEAIDASCASS